MTKLLKRSWIVLGLTTLLLTYGTACTATGIAQPDSIWVEAQLLRDARDRIDRQDLRIMLLENRAAERDSIYAAREREWQARLDAAYELADKSRTPFLEKILYAGLLGLGFWLAD